MIAGHPWSMRRSTVWDPPRQPAPLVTDISSMRLAFKGFSRNFVGGLRLFKSLCVYWGVVLFGLKLGDFLLFLVTFCCMHVSNRPCKLFKVFCELM